MSHRTSKRIFVGCSQSPIPAVQDRKRDKIFVCHPVCTPLHSDFIDFFKIPFKPASFSSTVSGLLIPDLSYPVFISKKLIIPLGYIQQQLFKKNILHVLIFVIFLLLRQSLCLTHKINYYNVALRALRISNPDNLRPLR